MRPWRRAVPGRRPARARRAVWALVCAFVAAVPGCAWLSETTDRVLPDRRPDYRKARQVERLEVPPDLTRPSADDALAVPEISPAGTATYSAYAGGRQGAGGSRARGLLPAFEGMRVERDGDRRWLVVRAEPERLWPKVREFWRGAGFGIEREDPAVGVMETGWAERHYDISQGSILRRLGKMLGGTYTVAVRDRFRVRIEPGSEPGTTEIYLSHFGLEEIYIDDEAADLSTVWQPRPRDPDLEAEMLRRLMVYLGTEEERARRMLATARERRPEARLERDAEGRPVLLVDRPFRQAWRIVGLALDRAGFMVEDRDRTAGTYYVRYADPHATPDAGKRRGLLARLAFWRREERPVEAATYQVRLSDEGERTLVRVADAEGAPLAGEAAGRILGLLERQIR